VSFFHPEKSPGRACAQGYQSLCGYSEYAHITRLAVRVQRRDGRESLRVLNLSTLEVMPGVGSVLETAFRS
jgi:hypothetical protein